MVTVRPRRSWLSSGLALLLLLALAKFLFHMLTNGQYGFHRDELATLDDARHLAWGYVAYPPVTPALARLSLALFGPSLTGYRLFAVIAQCAVLVVTGLMARELGGSPVAQLISALAVATSAASLFMSPTLMYVTVDYLWWVLVAYLIIRRIRTGDLRWWLATGAAVGLGMMTKYTMAFLVLGVVVGVLLTPLRRDLRSGWLWAGVGLALLIFLPNLIWQVRYGLISLEFLASIHARDVRIGRTQGFLTGQLYMGASPLLLPLWVAGLVYTLFLPGGRRFRIVGWLYVVPLILYVVLQGRDYYLAPAYPMLLAAGSVAWEQWLADRAAWVRRTAAAAASVALLISGVVFGALMLPLAPVNSPLWHVTRDIHDLFAEQIGWPELVQHVVQVYASLPVAEQTRTGILAGNYGEAGAIHLYGPAYGLPTAISGINSYWLRGYGDPPPETVIALGFQRDSLDSLFAQCEFAGPVTNLYAVENEETRDYPGIFVCRGLRAPWPVLWPTFRWFG
jgi:hypothetical protein